LLLQGLEKVIAQFTGQWRRRDDRAGRGQLLMHLPDEARAEFRDPVPVPAHRRLAELTDYRDDEQVRRLLALSEPLVRARRSEL
jgi:hypothetical protein